MKLILGEGTESELLWNSEIFYDFVFRALETLRNTRLLSPLGTP